MALVLGGAALVLGGQAGAAADLAPNDKGAPPTPTETLAQSLERRRAFPFRSDCGGNTQEMVACLWDRRNTADTTLLRLLGRPETLEGWRASRHQVCAVVARKAEGGSVHPIVWLSCENGLNAELLRQLQRPLLQSSDL
ncbi:MAG: hypothetical protein VKP70_09555 [Cyanobacteriota bacterium]|nr:hypothetical protein [Cyanobacteriota bacterium]